MVSGNVLLLPSVIFFSNLQRVDDILRFISDFTVDIEGVGHVCRLFTCFPQSSFCDYEVVAI